MKKLTRISFIASVIALSISSVSAEDIQQHRPDIQGDQSDRSHMGAPSQGRGGQFRHMLSKLNLSDMQKQQIRQILETNKPHDEMKKPSRENMAKVINEILQVLTPEQQSIVKQRIEQKMQHPQSQQPPKEHQR